MLQFWFLEKNTQGQNLLCKLSIKECAGKDCGKKKKEARLGGGEAQLDTDLMGILVDLIGRPGAKMSFQSCPLLACHGWPYVSSSISYWV